ncbi:MAG: 2-hydroxyacyl-CoA dehydratase family protein [bacterium]
MKVEEDVIVKNYETVKGMYEHTRKESPGTEVFFEPLVTYFRLAVEGLEKRWPLVWYFLGTVPNEPLLAMDITAVSPEYIAAVMSMVGTAEKYMDLPTDSMQDHICSLNRFPLGLAMSGDTALPELVVYAVNPCDAGLTEYSKMAHYLKHIPFFSVDVPAYQDARSIRYLASQCREMVGFVEGTLHTKLEMERLRQHIERSNEALEYQRKLLEFQRIVPCPTPSIAHILHGYANFGLPGVPEVLQWYKEQYAWVQGRIERGEKAVADEKVRLVWIANNIDFDLSIYDWLEREYGAVSVACLIGIGDLEPIDTSNEDRMFEGLAMRTMNYPMPRNGRRNVDAFVKQSIDMAETYRADAIVFAGNTGCKYHWATAKLATDMIKDATGLPVLCFEVSPWDARVVSSDAVKEKFSRFLEVYV